MKTITVETELNANFPNDETFKAFGGVVALRTGCAIALVAQGCRENSITFGEPFKDGDQWKIHGTGEVED